MLVFRLLFVSEQLGVNRGAVCLLLPQTFSVIRRRTKRLQVDVFHLKSLVDTQQDFCKVFCLSASKSGRDLPASSSGLTSRADASH